MTNTAKKRTTNIDPLDAFIWEKLLDNTNTKNIVAHSLSYNSAYNLEHCLEELENRRRQLESASFTLLLIGKKDEQKVQIDKQIYALSKAIKIFKNQLGRVWFDINKCLPSLKAYCERYADCINIYNKIIDIVLSESNDKIA